MNLAYNHYHDAWAQNDSVEDCGEEEGPGKRYTNTVCLVSGCDRNKGRNIGMCDKHARNTHRYGHPLGTRGAARETLLEAALAYGGSPNDRQTRRDLAIAALADYVARAAARYEVEDRLAVPAYAVDKMATAEFAELEQTAVSYALCDDSSEARFERLGRILLRRVDDFGRSVKVPQKAWAVAQGEAIRRRAKEAK